MIPSELSELENEKEYLLKQFEQASIEYSQRVAPIVKELERYYISIDISIDINYKSKHQILFEQFFINLFNNTFAFLRR
jgi:hypothetical protein